MRKPKKVPKETLVAIADAIREGKSAYEIAALVKLTEYEVRRAAKDLHMVRALNANEGCVTRQATPEELGDLNENVEFVLTEEPPAEPVRRRGRKPGPKEESPVIVPGEALLGTIRILEGISKDMIDAGAQSDPSSTGWLGYSYEQICEALKLLRMLDRICQRLIGAGE